MNRRSFFAKACGLVAAAKGLIDSHRTASLSRCHAGSEAAGSSHQFTGWKVTAYLRTTDGNLIVKEYFDPSMGAFDYEATTTWTEQS